MVKVKLVSRGITKLSLNNNNYYNCTWCSFLTLLRLADDFGLLSRLQRM